MQVNFGTGYLFGIPSGANPTPVNFGVLQSVDINFDSTLKQLYGQNQFPVALGRGPMKVTGKASYAQIRAEAFNSLFFGNAAAADGGVLQANNEPGAVPAPSGPYTITVVNSATWQTNLGVVNASTGIPLKRVASAPATGQYSVAAGVYTFAAADANMAVLISYTYTNSTATYKKVTLSNQLMGSAPVFQVNLGTTYNGKVFNLQLNSCTASKLAVPFKNQDFTINDFEFEANTDAADVLGIITSSE